MNDIMWSDWYETSFRMNSVPGVPQNLLPADGSVVSTNTPTLSVLKPFDAENDSLLIDFWVSQGDCTTVLIYDVPATSDTVTAVVDQPLTENATYFWQAKASDYFEESELSSPSRFSVNAEESAPSAFELIAPPNSETPPIAINTPQLAWNSSHDNDPSDSIGYKLQISIDSLFSFMSEIDSLSDTTYQVVEPLEWGRRYWWKVTAEDRTGLETQSVSIFTFKTMTLGDADGNGQVSIGDAVFIINYIFGGGPAPDPLSLADADCSGGVSIGDAVYIINYIFGGGPAPCGV
jgi:hypothetical protein